MYFHEITVNATGRRRSTRQHDAGRQESGAVAICAKLLRDHGPDFNEPISAANLDYIRLLFASKRSAAVATFYAHNELVTTSALLSGIDDQADAAILQAFRRMLVQAMHDTGIKARFNVDAFPERPAIVTVPWTNAIVDPGDIQIIADMETCLAAAFFGQVAPDARSRRQ